MLYTSDSEDDFIEDDYITVVSKYNLNLLKLWLGCHRYFSFVEGVGFRDSRLLKSIKYMLFQSWVSDFATGP